VVLKMSVPAPDGQSGGGGAEKGAISAARREGFLIHEGETAWPSAGSTLVCPACRASVVVVSSLGTSEVPTCHQLMRLGPPVACHEVRPRSPDDTLIRGQIYEDAPSGLVVRCTSGGPVSVRIAGRQMRKSGHRAVGRPQGDVFVAAEVTASSCETQATRCGVELAR
jgi:hypothetical protein